MMISKINSSIIKLNHKEKFSHIPVLLQEVLDAFNTTDKSVAYDMTFGFGGHSKGILTNNLKSKLFCLDRDPDSFHYALKLKETDKRVIPIKTKFSNIEKNVCEAYNIEKDSVDFILMDLGASSMQMDNDRRGFSLSMDSYLDMRMDYEDNTSITAYDIINYLSASHMREVLKKYGEVKEATKIVNTIVDYRLTVGPIMGTKHLADIISNTVTRKHYTDSLQRFSHPATLVFQALRIFVNDELNELWHGLTMAEKYLKPITGCLAVISFHSLEDRLVKWAFTNKDYNGRDKRFIQSIKNSSLDTMPDQSYLLTQIGDLIAANDEEIERNPRSRSAKLRIARKVKVS